MIKCIKLEIAKTIGSKRFIIAILGIAICMLLNFSIESRYTARNAIEDCLAISFDKSFALVILLLCVIPAGIQHCIEYNSGLCKYEIIRCGLDKYTFAKSFSAVSVGFFTTIVGMLITIGEAFVLVVYTNKSFENVVMSSVGMQHQIWQIITYALLCAVISQLAFAVSCFIPNIYIVIILPTVIYWALIIFFDSKFPEFIRPSVIYYPVSSETQLNEYLYDLGYAIVVSMVLIYIMHEIAHKKIKRRMENG